VDGKTTDNTTFWMRGYLFFDDATDFGNDVFDVATGTAHGRLRGRMRTHGADAARAERRHPATRRDAPAWRGVQNGRNARGFSPPPPLVDNSGGGRAGRDRRFGSGGVVADHREKVLAAPGFRPVASDGNRGRDVDPCAVRRGAEYQNAEHASNDVRRHQRKIAFAFRGGFW